MAALRARPDDGDESGQAPLSPWAVSAIGEPLDHGDHGDAVVDDVDQVATEFMVHAPVPAHRQGAERALWSPGVQGAAFTWVSAHGGAGSTSLARSSGLGVDLSGRWPDPQLGWPAAVAVVCRSDAAGLTAAAGMLAGAASGEVPDLRVAALVVVDDAPVKISKAMRARIHELGGIVPELVRVPWIRAWRDAPYTSDKSATNAAATVAAAVNNMREYR